MAETAHAKLEQPTDDVAKNKDSHSQGGANAHLQALAQSGQATPERVAELIAQHPGERDAIVVVLHSHPRFGNHFVSEVFSKLDKPSVPVAPEAAVTAPASERAPGGQEAAAGNFTDASESGGDVGRDSVVREARHEATRQEVAKAKPKVAGDRAVAPMAHDQAHTANHHPQAVDPDANGPNGAMAAKGAGEPNKAEGGVARTALKRALTSLITHETFATAPNGPNDRTRVGVGEAVTFSCPLTDGTWSTDNGEIDNSGTDQMWTAPTTAGRAKVQFTWGGETVAIDMEIVAPDATCTGSHDVDPAVAAAKLKKPPPEPGTAGVAMSLDLRVDDTVSFAHVTYEELDGYGGNPKGYYEGRPLPFHSPSPPQLLEKPVFHDIAALYNQRPKFEPGSFEWRIPNVYRIRGGNPHVIRDNPQTMRIEDSSGTMSIHKFGKSTTRGPKP